MPLRYVVAILCLPALIHAAPARPAKDAAERARALSKDAVALLQAGKPAEAESLLVEAVGLRPSDPALAYNLACARARQGKVDDAISELERAAAVGFTDFPQITRDPDLESLREQPRFKRLLARKEFYLRRTAEGTLIALRNRFGTTAYRYDIDPERRLIYAVATDVASLEPLKESLGEQAKALEAALFERKPEAYVTVLMPTATDYGKLVRFRNVPGLYVDDNKTLVAKEWSYILGHEFAHALHAGDIAPLGQRHAYWVTEGLGAMCEAADFAEGRFTPRDNPRFAGLPAAAKRKAIVPLDRLFAMSQQDFVRRPNLTYGQSAYLMLYLWEHQLLRRFYDAYKASYAKDPSGRAALEQVTGKTLPDFQEAWRLWLAGRAAKG